MSELYWRDEEKAGQAGWVLKQIEGFHSRAYQINRNSGQVSKQIEERIVFYFLRENPSRSEIRWSSKSFNRKKEAKESVL